MININPSILARRFGRSCSVHDRWGYWSGSAMTMDDTRVIHLKLNFVQTELPQTSSPSPFSPWPTRAKILAEFCRVFSSKTQVYCICTRRTTTTAYSTDISSATVLYWNCINWQVNSPYLWKASYRLGIKKWNVVFIDLVPIRLPDGISPPPPRDRICMDTMN